MKNFRLLAILVTGFLFLSACNEDEDLGAKADFVGAWDVVDVDIEINVNGQDIEDYLGQDEANLYKALISSEIESIFDGATITLNSNNTYTSDIPGESAVTGTWTLRNNKLILDEGSSDEFEFTVLSSSSSKLELQYTDIDNSSDIDFDGTNDEFEVIVDMTYIK
jgi:hypothetical protein